MWGYEAYPCEGLVAFEYILAMVRHPEVYRKLQDEVDQVVGDPNNLAATLYPDSSPVMNCRIGRYFF